MGAHRRPVNRLLALVPGCLLVFQLALLFIMLVFGGGSLRAGTASPAATRRTTGVKWFTVVIKDASSTSGADVGASDLAMMQKNPITVYKGGSAEAHGTWQDPDDPDWVDEYVFEGTYDDSRKTLGGSVVLSSNLRKENVNTEYGIRSTYVNTGDLDLVLKKAEDDEYYTGTITGIKKHEEQYSEETGVKVTSEGFTWEVSATTTEYVPEQDGDRDYEETGDDGMEGTEDHHHDGEGAHGSHGVPGPGSWTQWLTGTLVTGIIASGIGLLGGLLGGAPPDAATVPSEPREPDLPAPSDGGSEGAAGYLGSTEHVKDLTTGFFKNLYDDVTKNAADAWDNYKWAANEIVRPDNWRDALDGFTKWNHDFVEGQKELGSDLLKDPMGTVDRGLTSASEAGMNAVDAIKDHPLDVIKGVLGVDWWKNAMDPNKPLAERLGYAAVAGLNTIGLIEATGLKNLFAGEGGLFDDFARATGLMGEKPGFIGKGEFKIQAPRGAGPGRVPVVKAEPGLTGAQEGACRQAWGKATERARANVKHMKNALNSGDFQEKVDAVLTVRKDPLSINNLNAKSRQTISKFNNTIGRLQNDAMNDTVAEISRIIEKDHPGARVDVFRATNQTRPGARIRGHNDQDFTIQIVEKDGTVVDFPAGKAQEIHNDNFFKRAGSPGGTNPKRLGDDCRNICVTQHDPESVTLRHGDFVQMKAGRPTSHTPTVQSGLEYKANKPFRDAADNLKKGNIEGYLHDRWEGQRETVKAFRNQVEGRERYLELNDPAKAAEARAKIAPIRDTIDRMEKMLKEGRNPVQIDNFLKSRGTTAEELMNRISGVYGGITP